MCEHQCHASAQKIVIGSVAPCQVKVFWESGTESNRVQTQCISFIQFSRLVFPFIFSLNLHQFESLLSLNRYNIVPASVWLVQFCFVLHRDVSADTKFYLNNSIKKKKNLPYWRLYCRVLVHWRVFIFKQLILYLSHSWKYPTARAHCSHGLVSFLLQ